MVLSVCISCKREKETAASGKTKGICYNCYRKLFWSPKRVVCKRCGRERPHHSKGLCAGCYNSVFQIEHVKELNAQYYHNISSDLYKQLTKKCIICGFDKVVDLHHLDNNHSNNAENNLIGVCPNHHKMLHHRAHRMELFEVLKEKGFSVP